MLFFSTSHSLEHCSLSCQLLDQSPSAPASAAPSAFFSRLPEPDVRWGMGGRVGSSGAAIPCARESHFPSGTGRSPSHLLPEHLPSGQISLGSVSSAAAVRPAELDCCYSGCLSLAHGDLVCPSLWSFFHDRLGRISLKSLM